MMKKIKKIGSLFAVFLFNLYNTCFADPVFPNSTPRNGPHGRAFIVEEETKPTTYILIGLLVLVIIICAIIIIRRIIKNKKEKSDDNK